MRRLCFESARADAAGAPEGAHPLTNLQSRALVALAGHVALACALIAAAAGALASRSVPYLRMGYASMLSTALSYASSSPVVAPAAFALLAPVALMSVALASPSPAASRLSCIFSACVATVIAWASLVLAALALGGGQATYAAALAAVAATLGALSLADLRASGLARL